MKYFPVLLIMLITVISGCTQTTLQPGRRNISSDAGSFETFSVFYPEWTEGANNDPLNVITLNNPDKTCTFTLNAPETPVSWYEGALEKFVSDNDGTILSEDPLSYRMTIQDVVRIFKTKGIYCDDKSYFVILSCNEGNFDEVIYEKTTGSMKCEKEWSVPDKANKKLGMVIIPVQSSSEYADYADAYNLARNAGVQITHNFAFWGTVEKSRGEYDWMVQDYLNGVARNNGLETSIVFDIIHTTVVGQIPGDMTFTRFDDPELISRFSDFVVRYIDRYSDIIKYVEIGNEVDGYLEKHPDELEAYKTLYQQVYDSIKEKYPDVPVGTVYAYRHVKDSELFWIYDSLSEVGEMDAFTLYVHRDGFMFDRDPSEVTSELKEIETLTGDRMYAIEELGWSTSPVLKGNEADQVKVVDNFFDYLEEAPDRLQFMNYFFLHDRTAENCRTEVEGYFVPGDPTLNNNDVMTRLAEFVCVHGLLKVDGTPKPAWNEWATRAKVYNEI